LNYFDTLVHAIPVFIIAYWLHSTVEKLQPLWHFCIISFFWL